MPPFASVASTDFTYTGQRDLPGTGLMDYRARFYSPTLGRFTQPDSIIPGVTNSQSWNRYSYVLNNPINANDPSEHKCVGEADECLKDDGSKGGGFTGQKTTNPSLPSNNDGGGGDETPNDVLKTGNNTIPTPIDSIVPPGPGCIFTYEICVNNNSDILHYYPALTLHPSDMYDIKIIPPPAPYYSTDGKIIGARYIQYIPDCKTTKFDPKANGIIPGWAEIGANGLAWAYKEGAKALGKTVACPGCAEIITAVTIADLTNQSITFQGNPDEFIVYFPSQQIQPVDMYYRYMPR